MMTIALLALAALLFFISRERVTAKYSMACFLSIADADDDATNSSHISASNTAQPKRDSHSPKLLLVFGGLLACIYFLSPDLNRSMVFTGIGFSGWYLLKQSRARQSEGMRAFDILFHLPMAMERILMGIQAGLDVIPAIERAAKGTDGITLTDPVSHYLEAVLREVESGKPVSSALNSVGKQTSCVPLKHSFIHLGIAHDQGGELGTPLRDLADSAQLAYEQDVEERIATLPVKATGPLVTAFIGLIILFLTGPIVHIVKTSEDAKTRNATHELQ